MAGAAFTGSSWTFMRAGGVAGLVSAVLLVVSTAMALAPNEPDSSDQELLDFYTDSGNQLRLWGSAMVGLLAGLLFLWFLVALRDRLALSDPSGLPSLMYAAGIVFVVIAIVAGAIGTALPASLVYSENDIEVSEADLSTLRVVLILGNHWLAGAAASIAGAVVGLSSFSARRHRLYRRWLAWAGLVASVLMLPSMVAFTGFTLVFLMIWTAATGLWLARSATQS